MTDIPDEYLTDDINPRWRAWQAAQPDAVKAAISAYWQGTATDPSVAIGHPNAGHARAALLIKWCGDNYGYSP